MDLYIGKMSRWNKVNKLVFIELLEKALQVVYFDEIRNVEIVAVYLIWSTPYFFYWKL